MNSRERFLKTCRFEKPDRVFLKPQWIWKETLKRWRDEGLPQDRHWHEFFGFDRYEQIPINFEIIPLFDEKIVEANRKKRVIIDRFGVKKREFHENPELSMPQYIEFPVKDSNDWKEIKKRFNANAPVRYPLWWEDCKRCWKNRDYPLGIHTGSFFGRLRSLMGLETLLYFLYDQPELIKEMLAFFTDFYLDVIYKAVKEVELDYALFWEDMAFKTGPLISPRHFKEFMLPCYKRVTKFLRANGIDIILVDSDGNTDLLVDLWMEGGISGEYPLEVAAGVNAIERRKKYPNLILIGNIDKRTLAKNKKAIKEEVMSKVPYLLLKRGYLPFLDHSVPPDVPLENFIYYLDLIKKLIS
ncbi:hypothetical protein DRQ09_03905 [candidate division KSB1 bacterium]|nr:MAG: hypothetical protein DRQ09_03905 [candidate division KSB1 bacterium]